MCVSVRNLGVLAAQHPVMTPLSGATTQQLRESYAEWLVAMAAVQAETLRIARGGMPDRHATTRLMQAVELGRLKCRFLGLDPEGTKSGD